MDELKLQSLRSKMLVPRTNMPNDAVGRVRSSEPNDEVDWLTKEPLPNGALLYAAPIVQQAPAAPSDIRNAALYEAAQAIGDLYADFREADCDLLAEGASQCQNAVLALRSIAVPAPALPAAPGAWQPIETAPKDGREVLLFLGARWIRIEKARWFARWENWQLGDVFPESDDEYCGIGSEVPTHWMPLPPAPGAAPSKPVGLSERDRHDADQIASLILTDPDGGNMRISSAMEMAAGDNSMRFTVTNPETGHRYGVVIGITELTPDAAILAAKEAP